MIWGYFILKNAIIMLIILSFHFYCLHHSLVWWQEHMTHFPCPFSRLFKFAHVSHFDLNTIEPSSNEVFSQNQYFNSYLLLSHYNIFLIYRALPLFSGSVMSSPSLGVRRGLLVTFVYLEKDAWMERIWVISAKGWMLQKKSVIPGNKFLSK